MIAQALNHLSPRQGSNLETYDNPGLEAWRFYTLGYYVSPLQGCIKKFDDIAKRAPPVRLTVANLALKIGKLTVGKHSSP